MSNTIPPNLRWACRRGMLELDILLGNFLEKAYIHLPGNEQVLFVNLLKCEDQDLFEWLTGKKIPPDAETVYMINKIRATTVQP
jgi:antitoxin CptB